MRSWLLLVVLAGLAVHSTEGVECGGALLDDTGSINGTIPDKGNNCTWKITPKIANKSLTITFSQLILTGLDLTVYDDKALIKNLTTVEETSLVVISFTQNTTIILINTHLDSIVTGSFGFIATYTVEGCSQDISGKRGTFPLVFYAVGTSNFSCEFRVTKTPDGNPFLLTFSDINLPNADLTTKALDFTGTSLPDDTLMAADVSAFNLVLTVNTTTADQTFTALYQTVDARCSGSEKVATTGGILDLPSSQFPVFCYMQLTSNVTGSQILVTDTGSLQASEENIFYYDGLSTRTSLGNSQSGRKNIVSSGSSMTIVANLVAKISRSHKLKYKADAQSKSVTVNVSTDVSIIAVENQPIIYLQFKPLNESKMLTVLFSEMTTANVTVQDGNEQTIFIFMKDYVVFPITVADMMVVTVDGMKKNENLNVTVKEVDSQGCNGHYSTASGTISTSGINATTCTYAVLPELATPLVLQISKLSICDESKLEIYQGFSKTSTLLATVNSSSITQLPEIWSPDSSGFRIQWKVNDGKTCTSPQMTAQYWNIDPTAPCPTQTQDGGGILFQTPNYPNNYPLNAECTSPIDGTAQFLHVSVNQVDLKDQATLVLQDKDKNISSTFTSSNMADMVVPNQNSLSMNFKSGVKADGVLDVGVGAQIKYSFVDFGATLSDKQYTFNSSVLSEKSGQAVWIVDIPQDNKTKIANISLTIKGKDSLQLKIYDGNKTTSPLLDWKKQAKFQTNYSQFIVSYRYTKPSKNADNITTFSLSYIEYICVNVCQNGKCMKQEWLCNGVNECEDNSDELASRCGNVTIPTPRPPTPKPEPQKSSAGWYFFCIVIGLVLGAILMVAVPRIIRRFRHRSTRSGYGSMHEEA